MENATRRDRATIFNRRAEPNRIYIRLFRRVHARRATATAGVRARNK